MKEVERVDWDERFWFLALKSKNPIEAYDEIMEAENKPPGPSVDDLPPERQAWYRA